MGQYQGSGYLCQRSNGVLICVAIDRTPFLPSGAQKDMGLILGTLPLFDPLHTDEVANSYVHSLERRVNQLECMLKEVRTFSG